MDGCFNIVIFVLELWLDFRRKSREGREQAYDGHKERMQSWALCGNRRDDYMSGPRKRWVNSLE